jgi:hypothetical protein
MFLTDYLFGGMDKADYLVTPLSVANYAAFFKDKSINTLRAFLDENKVEQRGDLQEAQKEEPKEVQKAEDKGEVKKDQQGEVKKDQQGEMKKGQKVEGKGKALMEGLKGLEGLSQEKMKDLKLNTNIKEEPKEKGEPKGKGN